MQDQSVKGQGQEAAPRDRQMISPVASASSKDLNVQHDANK
jgi:hypothetical protein